MECVQKSVNSKAIGSIITRQEIIQSISKRTGMHPYQEFSKNNIECWSIHTLDYMRNLAEKVGYLDKTRYLGMFVVNKHLPSDYTVSQLRKDYDNRQW